MWQLALFSAAVVAGLSLHGSSLPRIGLVSAQSVALLAVEDHDEVEVTWQVYQRLIVACHEPDLAKGRARITKLITNLRSAYPVAPREAITRGQTMKKRAADVLAHFNRPDTLGFGRLTHCIAYSFLETGGFRPRLHRRS